MITDKQQNGLKSYRALNYASVKASLQLKLRRYENVRDVVSKTTEDFVFKQKYYSRYFQMFFFFFFFLSENESLALTKP